MFFSREEAYYVQFEHVETGNTINLVYAVFDGRNVEQTEQEARKEAEGFHHTGKAAGSVRLFYVIKNWTGEYRIPAGRFTGKWE